MKKATGVIILISAILYAGVSPADTQKVLLITVEDKTGEIIDLENALTEAAAKKIDGTSGYSSVSSGELARNWFGDLKVEDRQMFGSDPAEWIKDTRMVKPLLQHEDVGTIFEKKHLWKVDLVVMSEIRKVDSSLELYSEIIGMDTGRFYSLTTVCKKEDLEKIMREHVGMLLKKGSEVQKVEADEAIDRVKSVASYHIAALEGGGIEIMVDYTARRPNPELQNMGIFPSKELRGKTGTLKVRSKEGKDIELSFVYDNGELKSVQLGARPPADLSKSETLAVISKGGYIINFIFSWDASVIKSVKIEPLVNPYGEVK